MTRISERTSGPRWVSRAPRGLVLAVVVNVLVLLSFGQQACAQDATAAPAAALLSKRLELGTQLAARAFGSPLALTSHEGSDRVDGDVYAEVDRPFASVSATFTSGRAVCQLLFLHLNVHGCESSADGKGEALALLVGPKRALSKGMLYRMVYLHRVELAGSGYVRATLSAAQGPLSTRDYRIVFEAVPMGDGKSFVHFGYAYGYGLLGKLAMQGYLATAGRSKIGFTVVGQGSDGRSVYVRGERAALERSVIRYYLALLAQTSPRAGTPSEQREARLREWFALTERYPAQLHELDLGDYLHEKHDDMPGV